MPSAATARQPRFAYVGCFSEGREGHGKGISVFAIDSASGNWKLVEITESLASPGFLTLDRSGRFLYSVHGNGSEVSAYAIDAATGRLKLINRQPTEGKNGLHLEVHQNNRFLAVASIPGIGIFPINADGSLAPYVDSYSVDSPRSHMVHFDATGRFLLAPDHGNYKVHVFPFDAASGKLDKSRHFAVDRGDVPPRHLVFHPAKPWVYDVNRNSTVTAYHWDAQAGQLKPFQVVRTVPQDYQGKNAAAEVAMLPSGRFVYVSNTVHNSIGIFRVDEASGELTAIGWESIQGKKPRFFTLDAGGTHLYSAALDSDRIVIFRINGDTGQLTPTGQVVETASPCCIAFAYG